MSKRFIDTSIWTQNRWFRKLKPKDKLFWIYLFCHCDSVGVWEEDFELASFIIGDTFTKEEVTKVLGSKIKWFTDRKVWIVDFCDFQYGTLDEEKITNKPHQSYIQLLKKHSLWIDYKNSIHRDKEKEEEKEREKECEEKPFVNGYITPEYFDKFWKIYPKKTDKGKAFTKWNQLCNKKDKRPTWIELKSALLDQIKSERWQDKQFIPMPTTWLNNNRWLDDPKEMIAFKDREENKCPLGHIFGKDFNIYSGCKNDCPDYHGKINSLCRIANSKIK